jgi:hypothetical protein
MRSPSGSAHASAPPSLELQERIGRAAATCGVLDQHLFPDEVLDVAERRAAKGKDFLRSLCVD